MREVSSSNQLIHNKDVKLLTVGDPDDFYNYIKYNPNMTWYGVVWCTSSWKINSRISIPCQYSNYTTNQVGKRMLMYALFYNNSLEEDMFVQPAHHPTPRDPILI